MKSSIRFLNLLALGAALAGSGCYMTKQTMLRSELDQHRGRGPIRALTVDTTLYTFETFSVTDSTLIGRGTAKREGVTSPFAGSVPLTEIVFIERRQNSTGRGILIVPALAAAGGGLIALLESSTFEIWEASSGSCPYIYAFDGVEFTLEAEAFATSISRTLETRTFSLLPSLVPVDGRLLVRVRNERPETHLLNSVQLFVADAAAASSAVLDIENVLWPVRHAVPPLTARDHSGRAILGEISEKDQRYWRSDLRHTSPSSGFRDRLEVEFDVPSDAREATLVVHAINTELVTAMYRSVGTLIGDATLEFYRALEHDSQLQAGIREWIRESSLLIEVANGSGWKEMGIMLPEANVTPFARALRIGNLADHHGRLRLRLSALTDVWRVDAVYIDFSPVQPLPLHPLEMTSVSASDGSDWEDAIRSSDSSYATILPPNHVDITFRAALATGMRNPVYVVATQGYLYEWFPAPTQPVSAVSTHAMTGSDRIETLKLLIQKKDLLLPPICAEWRRDSGCVCQSSERPSQSRAAARSGRSRIDRCARTHPDTDRLLLGREQRMCSEG